MTVDAILALVTELTAEERVELLDRLRERYEATDAAARQSAPRADQTGVYSIDQLIDRAKRSG
jgi:HAMP domain-containing protein